MVTKTNKGKRSAATEIKPEQTPSLDDARPPPDDPSKALGRRERNKAAKVRRISAAARQQFATKGYDGTTLRDIAHEADVALGTVGSTQKTSRSWFS